MEKKFECKKSKNTWPFLARVFNATEQNDAMVRMAKGLYE